MVSHRYGLFLAESSFSECAHNICISSKKSAQKCASIHLPCPDGRVAANQQKRERKGGRDKKKWSGVKCCTALA